jgi:hypothetical protein
LDQEVIVEVGQNSLVTENPQGHAAAMFRPESNEGPIEIRITARRTKSLSITRHGQILAETPLQPQRPRRIAASLSTLDFQLSPAL